MLTQAHVQPQQQQKRNCRLSWISQVFSRFWNFSHSLYKEAVTCFLSFPFSVASNTKASLVPSLQILWHDFLIPHILSHFYVHFHWAFDLHLLRTGCNEDGKPQKMPFLFSFTQTTLLPTPSKPWSSLPTGASHCSALSASSCLASTCRYKFWPVGSPPC